MISSRSDAMPYIAIEGCIASGKTTLARALAQEFGISPTLEDYQDVPSLELFYKDPDTYAFETEIQFTQAHFNRLAPALELLEGSILITDFTLRRDLLFATITLERQPDRLMEYRRFWQSLASQVLEPDQIVLLEAPADELLSRIRQRGRPFEQDIGKQYLERLATGLREIYSSTPQGFIRRFDSTNLSELLRTVPGSLAAQTGSGPRR